jgi:hypothetical protein
VVVIVVSGGLAGIPVAAMAGVTVGQGVGEGGGVGGSQAERTTSKINPKINTDDRWPAFRRPVSRPPRFTEKEFKSMDFIIASVMYQKSYVKL